MSDKRRKYLNLLTCCETCIVYCLWLPEWEQTQKECHNITLTSLDEIC